MRQRLASSLLLIISMLWLMPGLAHAANAKPYFKVFGGDVFAGGWFNTGATGCSIDANYQAPSANLNANRYAGGILGWATSDRLGASTDSGATALGLIEGKSSSQYGFFSGAAGYNQSDFANTSSGSSSIYWGGFFAGATPQAHCVPDYFGTKQSSPTDLGAKSSYNLNLITDGSHNKQYLMSTAGASLDLTSTAVTVNQGADVTVFVNGNAYIDRNISYDTSYDATNVPKLAIVVKGDLYIAPSVTNLDGLYIVQPKDDQSAGTVWTCHQSSSTLPDGQWIKDNCGNQLTINGALIAAYVNFLRTNGDLASAPAGEDATSSNSAEIINYTPAMVLGGGFFNSQTNTNGINSLTTLPPVF